MNDAWIIVVSGLPRSGTSMLMRMLSAGGILTLTDERRGADEDNPRGYFEFEAVKGTRQDASWVGAAKGKAVKVIHALLADLPAGFAYRVLFVHRNMDEVVTSQRKMLERAGKAGAKVDAAALKRVFGSQIEGARRWAEAQQDCAWLDVHYDRVIAEPLQEARRIAEFLGLSRGVEAMAGAVDPELYRNRA